MFIYYEPRLFPENSNKFQNCVPAENGPKNEYSVKAILVFGQVTSSGLCPNRTILDFLFSHVNNSMNNSKCRNRRLGQKSEKTNDRGNFTEKSKVFKIFLELEKVIRDPTSHL